MNPCEQKDIKIRQLEQIVIGKNLEIDRLNHTISLQIKISYGIIIDSHRILLEKINRIEELERIINIRMCGGNK
jgi:hypothetical protein